MLVPRAGGRDGLAAPTPCLPGSCRCFSQLLGARFVPLRSLLPSLLETGKRSQVKTFKSFFLLGIQSGCSGQTWKRLLLLLPRALAASFRVPPGVPMSPPFPPGVPCPPCPSPGLCCPGKGFAQKLLLLLQGWRWPRLPPAPCWGGLQHRDLTSPPTSSSFLSLGQGLGLPLSPPCWGNLFPSAVVAPQVHSESSCFSSCCLWGFWDPPEPSTSWVDGLGGAGRVSPHPHAGSEPRLKDPPPLATALGTILGDCPLQQLGLQWQSPGFSTLSHPAPLSGPQQWWLLGSPLTWGDIMDQKSQSTSLSPSLWGSEGPGAGRGQV
ncbi:PREDICTED: uncharacterized protein LOC106897357 [Calidris pugnax]|uniref:uncharacterized protein LOC106897357 n=1 Tax=Calidris pugnax TaxID=198806 RepID=UPI00071CD7D0|nr:PREDICTED: uncharacterized protein LOC106897357 [Calidris pugnax]